MIEPSNCAAKGLQPPDKYSEFAVSDDSATSCAGLDWQLCLACHGLNYLWTVRQQPNLAHLLAMIRHLFRTESLAWAIALSLIGVFATVFSFNIADPDLWGHVRYGQHMLDQGRIFVTDPYSYLSNGFPWVNHELLCEFTLGFLEPRWGSHGLLFWKCFMGLLTIAPIVWAHRRMCFEPLTIVTVGVLLALNLWPGWTIRPQLFTYVFLSVLALIMTEHCRGSMRILWFVPPLVIAWTNAHGGFVAGLGLFAVHGWLAIFRHVKSREARWKQHAFQLLAVMVFAALAPLVNPYGPKLLVWVWDSLTWPRPEISEWWPISIWSKEYLSFKAFVLLTFVAFVFTRRPRAWSEIIMLTVAGLESFLHRRHAPLFAILAAYWVPQHLDDCLARLRDRLARRSLLVTADRGSLRMYWAGLVALILLFAGLTTLQLRSLRVERATFPVSAFEFIEENKLSGRMVTEFNWGQYCLYAFWPRILISVDGRFDTSYSRPILDVNLDFMMGDSPRWRNRSPETGPFQADRVLDLGKPNLALVDRQRPNCVKVIEQRADWFLLYQDALAQVWGRQSVYDDPSSPEYLAPSQRVITDEPQAGWAAYPALPLAANRPEQRAN
jgi:hypothetical protein